MPPSEGRPIHAARRRLADAARALSAQVVGCDAPDQVFGEIADAVEALTRSLSAEPRYARRYGGAHKSDEGGHQLGFDYGEMIDFTPISGIYNPFAAPLRTDAEDGAVIGSVNFPVTYEGSAGTVHNGHLAAIFDEVFGVVQSLTGRHSMTGTLTVRYREPCPLGTVLRLEGRVRNVKGRKILAEATMRVGTRIVADAEAVLIVVDVERFKSFEGVWTKKAPQ
jgi:acyl-coenzyme A thioesterase PaaI-like protein